MSKRAVDEALNEEFIRKLCDELDELNELDDNQYFTKAKSRKKIKLIQEYGEKLINNISDEEKIVTTDDEENNTSDEEKVVTTDEEENFVISDEEEKFTDDEENKSIESFSSDEKKEDKRLPKHEKEKKIMMRTISQLARKTGFQVNNNCYTYEEWQYEFCIHLDIMSIKIEEMSIPLDNRRRKRFKMDRDHYENDMHLLSEIEKAKKRYKNRWIRATEARMRALPKSSEVNIKDEASSSKSQDKSSSKERGNEKGKGKEKEIIVID